MNELYGIDPSSPKDLKDLKALLTRFGLAQGRFIARYPSDWEQELLSSFSEVSELDRVRLTRLIQMHQTIFLSAPIPFNRSKIWPRNVAEHCLPVRAFDRILARNPNEEGFETLEDYLWDEDDDLGASRGAFIDMAPECYADACVPLFECSSEVHLSDRFFQLRNQSGIINRKHWSVLRALVEKASASSKCRLFVLHFERPSVVTVKNFELRLEEDLQEIGTEFSFDFLYDIRDSMHHGRYIFSIYGGLQFDHGFEVTRSQKNHVHWMSSSELNHLHIYYGLATKS